MSEIVKSADLAILLLTQPIIQLKVMRNSDNSNGIISTERGRVRRTDSRKNGTEVLME